MKLQLVARCHGDLNCRKKYSKKAGSYRSITSFPDR